METLENFFCYFDEMPGFLKDFLSMGLGTLLGGYLSFQYGKRWELRKKTDVEIVLMRRAQYELIRQYTEMVNFNNQFLEDLRKVDDKGKYAIKFRHSNSYRAIDTEALHLLLQKGESELVQEIDIQNEKFLTFMNEINGRNEFIEESQRLITSGKFNKVQLEIQFNTTLFFNNSVLDSYQIAFDGWEDVNNKFINYLKTHYPSEKFLKIEKIKPTPTIEGDKLKYETTVSLLFKKE